MGLLRIVIQKPEAQPFAGLGVTLHRTEPVTAPESATKHGTTDNDGVVRFLVEPGSFKVQVDRLPDGVQLPKYGTTVRLQDFAEGIEQVIRLVQAN